MADVYYEVSGRIPYPEELLDYPEDWLDDFKTYRKYKYLMQKKVPRGKDSD